MTTKSSLGTGTLRCGERCGLCAYPSIPHYRHKEGWRVADAVIKAYEHAPVER
jgi:hypothetical protein